MSETIDHNSGAGAEHASGDDVERTLQELRREKTDLERTLNTERAARQRLEGNLDSERVARTTAEIQRDEATTRVVSEAEQRWNAEKAAAEGTISSRQQALDAAEEDYARHADLGDWKAAAKAQRAIAEATTELHSTRQYLKHLDTNKERLIPKAPPARVDTPAPATRANHRYAQHIPGELVSGEEAWLDQRPKFQNDQSYREEVYAASNLAVKRHARGSDGYFREMERLMGEEAPRREAQHDPVDDGNPPRREAGGRQPSADLPASRRAAPGQQPAGSRADISLSADERDMADGIYGDPNRKDFYIADPKDRYLRYHEMKLKVADRM